MSDTQWVYFFGENGRAEGHGSMKDLLGGKGAGLAEMTNAGVPVPPGFTLTTAACRAHMQSHGVVPEDAETQFWDALTRLEKVTGRELGGAHPLLVSVRSGAKFSMPGMMDTILNLGLNDLSVGAFERETGDPRFAFDCYRRFITMYSNVVLELPRTKFDHALESMKERTGAENDAQLTAESLRELAAEFLAIVAAEAGRPFPQDAREQLRLARNAVFRSWMNPRAIEYRRIYHIADDLGTAVNVQTMVFGNRGSRSATGVGFTRNPSTGEKKFFGEFLVNAQGEDVVAGIRTPRPIAELETELPNAYAQLREITARLEKNYRDVQDFEFTIEEDRLYMLQTRSGKRTGFAAVKIAVDMVDEGLIDEEEAVARVEPSGLDAFLHPMFDAAERKKYKAVAKGLPASPGAASGRAVFTAEDAVKWAARGESVILVRKETVPDDIAGMKASAGVLTATGGATSHAAVVGRQMGKPAVVGCAKLRVDEAGGATLDGKPVKEGDWLSFDGSTGEVMLGRVPTQPSEVIQVVMGKRKEAKSPLYQMFTRFLSWADKHRKLKIRANADTPLDARIAVAFGAEGIGLCRTEHMFFAPDRIPLVQAMILATDEAGREAALSKLLPMQRGDFAAIFKEMAGRPVTIRTLDPPLHEFLPKREDLMVKVARLEAEAKAKAKAAPKKPVKKGAKKAKAAPPKDSKTLVDTRALLQRVEELHEFNPMMGHRGCRLGISYPEITRMQARAIIEAALLAAAKKGVAGAAVPEIMVPLVGTSNELRHQKAVIDDVAAEVMKKKGAEVQYQVGTMIELPRAAMTADKIAELAQFFSFGTNDLTQMTYGFSRDDAGKFLADYQDAEIMKHDPFTTIDVDGVGELMKIARDRGRATRPGLKIGICGEHGGDPATVGFCHEIGLDYVSCSPFRVPIARLAAAQAAIRERRGAKA